MQLEWRGLESLDAKTLIIIAGIFLAVIVLLFIVKKIFALIITAAAIFAPAASRQERGILSLSERASLRSRPFSSFIF